MKQTSKVRPKKSDFSPKVTFFLADDTRQEADGKVSLMGLYADNVIVVNKDPNDPPITKSNPVGFDGLSLMFTISGIEGKFEISAELEGGLVDDRKSGALLATQSVTFPDKKRSINVILKIKPFITGTLGTKIARFRIQEKIFEFPFEIRAPLKSEIEERKLRFEQSRQLQLK